MLAKFLIPYTAKIEEHVKKFSPGYYHVLVVGTEYSNSPLDIMKKGLKNDIKKQTINIMDS